MGRGVIPVFNNGFFFAGTLEDWLTLNLSESSILNHKWHWRFGILLDLIWQRRNMLIFHNILWNEHDLLLQA
ncbi:hypothetical protein JHK82_029530 [Glycine max]|uniref:Uncharacterized protein n=1 Tax=Glycine max TaxID=3847 RepID=A0A0R0I776_SOYBN|nr:hypothetical protein JHK82_029530 [Glycine max]KRH36185.1 hypothetical protein GLYMA_10G289500v4 [Glycine max]